MNDQQLYTFVCRAVKALERIAVALETRPQVALERIAAALEACPLAPSGVEAPPVTDNPVTRILSVPTVGVAQSAEHDETVLPVGLTVGNGLRARCDEYL